MLDTYTARPEDSCPPKQRDGLERKSRKRRKPSAKTDDAKQGPTAGQSETHQRADQQRARHIDRQRRKRKAGRHRPRQHQPRNEISQRASGEAAGTDQQKSFHIRLQYHTKVMICRRNQKGFPNYFVFLLPLRARHTSMTAGNTERTMIATISSFRLRCTISSPPNRYPA